jgi:hypothetical protein
MVRDPVRELRLVVAKLALLLAFVYLLVLITAVVGIVTGNRLPVLGYAFLLLPGAAFVVAARDAVRLHRVADPERGQVLWRNCALYGGIGLVLLIAAGVIIDQMGN